MGTENGVFFFIGGNRLHWNEWKYWPKQYTENIHYKRIVRIAVFQYINGNNVNEPFKVSIRTNKINLK